MAAERRRGNIGSRNGAAGPRAPVVAKDQRDEALRERGQQAYLLRLYITGMTPASSLAIERVRAFCDEHLRGRYQLEVIDIYQLPALARDEQIVATPTLIKVLPLPLRRFIGNLSSVEKILFGLDLRELSHGTRPRQEPA